MKQRSRFPLLLVLLSAFAATQADDQLASPAKLYGELFERVQTQRVFSDGKSFVDTEPRQPPAAILEAYRREQSKPGFDLRAFVGRHFVFPAMPAVEYRSDPNQDVREHIDTLWPVLTRGPDPSSPYSSLLPLPNPYIVPGGRFKEVYYWDSYFTMIGLEESGRHDMVVAMVNNFADLIDRVGHIPNGNRSYYLSRSQPPFFAAMVELVAERDGDKTYARYLPQLEKEHAFWMQGADTLAKGAAHRRVVKLADGAVLNRYWDDQATPREESYREDVETARKSGRPVEEMYRNLRAAAESGWDFSSRWFADGRTLATIQVVKTVAVDLNSLLYQLERTLAKSYRLAGQPDRSRQMQRAAERRKAAMQKYLWDRRRGIFVDYLWEERKQSEAVTLAALYPLYFSVAEKSQAAKTAALVESTLLAPHGLLTTAITTGEQWDAPNGWAPLQWMAIKGLHDNGQEKLARTVARRWMAKNIDVYRATGKLVEKYDVTDHAEAGGGEYPLQDGFGWTNGVLRKLIVMYPQSQEAAASNRPRRNRSSGSGAEIERYQRPRWGSREAGKLLKDGRIPGPINGEAAMTSLYDIPLKQIDGAKASLGDYRGKVLLVVNVASKCGLTPQYEGLERLYQSRRDQGLEVLGFPANNFMGQEPGTDAEIGEFCSVNYDVHFPLFSKISVLGADKHPLYAKLTAEQPASIGDGPFRERLKGHGIAAGSPQDVLWNFEKFLVDRKGAVVARFAPDTAPDAPQLTAAIDAELKKR